MRMVFFELHFDGTCSVGDRSFKNLRRMRRFFRGSKVVLLPVVRESVLSVGRGR